MKHTDNYIRKGMLVRVIDGDTVVANIDLGFDVWTKQRFRLYNIQAPETNTQEGKDSKEFLIGWMRDWTGKDPLIVEIIRTPGGKFSKTFGRYVAILYKGNVNINTMLVKKGYAKKWTKFKRFKK